MIELLFEDGNKYPVSNLPWFRQTSFKDVIEFYTNFMKHLVHTKIIINQLIFVEIV